MSRLFCFGLGYTARHLARALRQEGWGIAGTTRDEAVCAALAAEGYAMHLFDRARPLADPAAALAGTTHLLLSIPPDETGDPVLDLHGDKIAALPGLVWAAYLSSTNVYGDHGGGWVEETSLLRPSGARGQRRVAAETGWRSLRRRGNLPLHIFRLAGIYGPGRNALDTVRRGTAQRIEKPGQVFSRIHVEDLVATLRASMARPDPGAVYNVCDDDAAAPAEVVAYACELLGVTPPPLIPFAAAQLSAMARSFYDDNKRVANRRIKEELGVTLLYPSYRDGLRSLAAQATLACDDEANGSGGPHAPRELS